MNEGWQFSQMNKETWYDAEVPGSVQRDLVRHGVLPDPFYGTNEELVQWVEDENWDFRKTFVVTSDQLRYDDALLTFEGLDTHADVFLNGSRIAVGKHVRRTPGLRETPIARGRKQTIYPVLLTDSRMMPARTTFGYDYPAGNDHREEKLSIYNRKAPYHFGWDWGIRIVQMGIWKPVTLSLYNTARISDFHVKQEAVTEEKAKINNEIEIFSIDPHPIEATITVEYGVKNEVENQSLSHNITLHPGTNYVILPLEIENPKL